MMMHNIWNPTHEEIREWAYEGSSLPHTHWALTLNDFNNLPVLIELAGDSNCPKRSFFLDCLYKFTEEVIERDNMHELVRLETTLEKLETYMQAANIEAWIHDSQKLLKSEAYSVPFYKGMDLYWSANWPSNA
ncbi:hypothetical protein [Paenibacillus spongiae]|uniref:Uncharacterized protein n=1 Tax=Paenibacillus spongiae TaxID=2909671 RepID=A0ABY5SJ11_9BACL|nr:hypothetical protein [Paenibacillus spongiae]UVI32697.1 hypothetical protein L1F29_13095 [Paenibacillus spongiae]